MNRKTKDSPTHPIVRTAMLLTGFTAQRIRAREVLFYIDLVKNIFEASIHCPDFELQTVQILRLFKHYHEWEWGEMTTDGSAVTLTLNAQGLFHILESLVQVDHILPLNECIFLQWFLDSYQDHIRTRLKAQLTPEQQDRLEQHLGPQALFTAQMKRLTSGMADMQRRVDDSLRLMKFVEKARLSGLKPAEIVESLPSDFSYRLSHQKRFRTWLRELPDDVMPFEIEQGIANRQNHLYRRLLASMRITRDFYDEALLGHPFPQEAKHLSSVGRS